MSPMQSIFCFALLNVFQEDPGTLELICRIHNLHMKNAEENERHCRCYISFGSYFLPTSKKLP